MVRTIKSEDDFRDVIADIQGLVVADAFATWCGPCKAIAPKLDAMASEYPHVLFLKIDVDEVSSFADRYNVTAMPTIIFFKNNTEVARVVGANEKQIRQNVERYM